MGDHRIAIRPTHEAADAFWKYWRENGDTHKHGYYESTWGAINAALRIAEVVPHNYGGLDMNDAELTKALIETSHIDGYFDYAAVVARRLPKALHEQLKQLINGPVWDGDVISKSLRDQLIDLGLAVRVCCKGEQGHTGATYFAHAVMEIADEIKTGKRG